MTGNGVGFLLCICLQEQQLQLGKPKGCAEVSTAEVREELLVEDEDEDINRLLACMHEVVGLQVVVEGFDVFIGSNAIHRILCMQ